MFTHVTPISRENNPQNILVSDPDNDEHYELTSQPVSRATPAIFGTETRPICNRRKNIHCKRSRNSFQR